MTDTASLANELASLSSPAPEVNEVTIDPTPEPELETDKKAKKAKKAEEVKEENLESANAEAPPEGDPLSTTALLDRNYELQDEIVALKAQIQTWTVPEQAVVEAEDDNSEPAEFFYQGIKHPDYRLKTVYVPSHAKSITKANGYDSETGESYAYTMAKIGHKPPGSEHHRMETFNIRLDSRVVVPQFVAEALGERVDTQDYFG